MVNLFWGKTAGREGVQGSGPGVAGPMSQLGRPGDPQAASGRSGVVLRDVHRLWFGVLAGLRGLSSGAATDQAPIWPGGRSAIWGRLWGDRWRCGLFGVLLPKTGIISVKR